MGPAPTTPNHLLQVSMTVWLFLAFPEPEMGMQERGSSFQHTHIPLFKHSQPWCPSVLSYVSLMEIRESSLSFVAFGFPP